MGAEVDALIGFGACLTSSSHLLGDPLLSQPKMILEISAQIFMGILHKYYTNTKKNHFTILSKYCFTSSSHLAAARSAAFPKINSENISNTNFKMLQKNNSSSLLLSQPKLLLEFSAKMFMGILSV